jgi:hypothetical protein
VRWTTNRWLAQVPVRGGTLLVDRWGPSIGGDRGVGDAHDVVVAAHGGTSHHLARPVVARHLAPDVTVLAPDLRGAAPAPTSRVPSGWRRTPRT